MLTSSTGLPLFSPLYDLLFKLSRPFLIFLITLIPELFNSYQEVIDVFGAIRVDGYWHCENGYLARVGKAAIEEELWRESDSLQ